MVKKLSKRKVKERRKTGLAKAYLSRAAAVRKLQLSLKDFRRLCILKGVYPVEPKNKTKVTKGNSRHKTYYFTNDIQHLMHEPIVHKFWDFKVFMKRISKAKGRHDLEKLNRVKETEPIYRLNDVVKERYPRFVDALRDCDDALSMCFLFSMFAKGGGRPDEIIDMSRRLTIEFMHFVIHSHSLRKVFISIKGYYYQADIAGQTVTWVVPHHFVIDRVSNVDLNVMRTFTEFYITLLGFINFKLYRNINAIYPPQIEIGKLKDAVVAGKTKIRPGEDDDDGNEYETRNELVSTLNKPIKTINNKSVSNAESMDQQVDSFQDQDDTSAVNSNQLSFHQTLALENLFKGLKFFLNREVPRESLTFVIRSFSGEVSWDSSVFPGATFDESDESITHHIIDRDTVREKRLNRIYVQPQWVFDSVNNRMLLPAQEYFPGSKLPPHLSPFVAEKKGDYVPPDKIKMDEIRKRYESEKLDEQNVKDGNVSEGPDSEFEVNEEDSEAEDTKAEAVTKPINVKRQKLVANSEFNEVDEFGNKKVSREVLTNANTVKNREKKLRKKERDSNKSKSRAAMNVKPGKLMLVDKKKLEEEEEAEHKRMGVMMIPKKKKRLYDRITKTRREKKRKVEKLRNKRKVVDSVNQRQKSQKKFEHKMAKR